MADTNFAMMGESDDLPRTLRREKEARERAKREEEARKRNENRCPLFQKML